MSAARKARAVRATRAAQQVEDGLKLAAFQARQQVRETEAAMAAEAERTRHLLAATADPALRGLLAQAGLRHQRMLEAARDRAVAAVNARLWNEAAGQYDNLELWGRSDARTAQENALAVVAGVVPEDRVPRALAAVKARCWAPAGSLTITPPMSHVPLHIDHNHKM